jgi:hypothetical protein
MFGLRAFTISSQKAATITLGYFWSTLYLLALPILLSFAVNGFIVTWTLPEWYTLFIGLLCLIQVLVVAFVGILMTGITAGLGRIIQRRA